MIRPAWQARASDDSGAPWAPAAARGSAGGTRVLLYACSVSLPPRGASPHKEERHGDAPEADPAVGSVGIAVSLTRLRPLPQPIFSAVCGSENSSEGGPRVSLDIFSPPFGRVRGGLNSGLQMCHRLAGGPVLEAPAGKRSAPLHWRFAHNTRHSKKGHSCSRSWRAPGLRHTPLLNADNLDASSSPAKRVWCAAPAQLSWYRRCAWCLGSVVPFDMRN